MRILMLTSSMGRLAAATAACTLLAHVASATAVTINALTASGSPAENTVVVFNPLDTTPPASKNSAIIDQIDKRFVPLVSVVRTGTTVTFPNSDNIFHQ